MPLPSLNICIISAGRSSNVKDMERKCGAYCTWYVPYNQYEDYERAGAKSVVGVIGSMPMKCKQLNQALLDSFQRGYKTVATLDDDIVWTKSCNTGKELPVYEVAHTIAQLLLDTPYYLAGPFVGTNAKWSPGVKHYGRLLGAMMIHKKGSTVFFDENLKENVDLDYCIAHHIRYKGVLLYGNYQLKNLYSTNPGGLQNYRTKESAEKSLARMKKKWEKYGCKFWLNHDRVNPQTSRIPWKKLTTG